MANSLLITCLAFFSLVSNFCFGLNPNDWGPGSGWGSPSSMGSGPVGPGSPPVYGSGSPPSGSGWGSGSGSPPGFGYGPGSPGYGSGSSSTPGFGSGSGSPDYGSGSGVPPGYGSGPGSPGYGLGSGSPPGYGSGPGSPGYGSGSPPSGSGSPPGSGSRAEWSTDQATFYGPPTGDGNDVNACGTKDLSNPPYLSMVTGVNDATFQNKMACGHCYQIKCSLDICSGQPVTVTVTDWSDVHHKFDLSGTAFGKMAKPGQEDQLRAKGIIDIQYQQVECNYNSGANVASGVNVSSIPN
ncbi:Putative expansin-B2 [Striga hermonthica]|uniref:Expansin-B2 n=1 Tax=Striga hermonthica TaxID=68872 RepID=A0A9N7RBH2_STRHE|nr:Putative expansin-B2 [Striga hermonthica]